MTLPVAKPQPGETGWHPKYWNLVDVINAIDERIRDVSSAALMPGTGIAITVSDANDTVTITNTVSVDARVVALIDAATITPNADTTDIAKVTLGGNRTFAAPSGAPVEGQKLIVRLKQPPAGGPWVPVWDAIYRFAGNTVPTLTTTANKTDYLGFIYNSDDAKWDCVAVKLNL